MVLALCLVSSEPVVCIRLSRCYLHVPREVRVFYEVGVPPKVCLCPVSDDITNSIVDEIKFGPPVNVPSIHIGCVLVGRA